MFDFRGNRQWQWPNPVPRPLILVDGKEVSAKSLEPIVGNYAYVQSTNDKTLPTILSRLQVEALWLYEVRGSDISLIRNLTRLKHLRIEWAIKINDLEPIRSLINLETLFLSDTPKIPSLDPIASLTKLDHVTFQGGVWNRNTIQSLQPIASLQNLKQLELANLKVLDGSLHPLRPCMALKKLEISNQFSVEEFTYLAAVRSDIDCDLFQPWVPLMDDRVMLTGKRKILHRIHDRDQLVKFEQQFWALKRRFELEQ